MLLVRVNRIFEGDIFKPFRAIEHAMTRTNRKPAA